MKSNNSQKNYAFAILFIILSIVSVDLVILFPQFWIGTIVAGFFMILIACHFISEKAAGLKQQEEQEKIW